MTGANRPPVRGVLLDIDDTLVDTRAAFRAAIGQVVSVWIPQLDAHARAHAVRHWILDEGGAFAAYTRGELSFSGQRRIRAERLHARLGGPELDDAGFARWDADYEAAFRGAWRAHPDGVALVRRLGALGVPLGAVTNAAGGYQQDKLRVVGLADLPVLASMDDLGRGKPDPEVFRLACRRLGLPPGQVCYVGDELDVDARGARDAGLVGVWLDRHGDRDTARPLPDDVPVVRTLGELATVLDLHGAG
jgi:putative hydrolase of the HAD superfamily